MQGILFFDGTCAMCNGLVNFILKHDKNKNVKFAPLQGHTALKYLPKKLRSDLNTAVFLDQEGIHSESDAIINVVGQMGGIFSLVKFFKIFPKNLRNKIYKLVAKNRYRFFGYSHCALLNKEERLRVLE